MPRAGAGACAGAWQGSPAACSERGCVFGRALGDAAYLSFSFFIHVFFNEQVWGGMSFLGWEAVVTNTDKAPVGPVAAFSPAQVRWHEGREMPVSLSVTSACFWHWQLGWSYW